MPLIMAHNSDYWTGFSVSNVGSQATTVTCTLEGDPIPPIVQALDPGEALTYDTIQNDITGTYIGSATCTASDGDTKIVGIVNELKSTATTDTLLTYEGTNN